MKLKAITFSYDDGVTQDERLVKIFNKYGLKATFNLNSELLDKPGELNIRGVRVSHNKISPSDVSRIYAGHEVAAHTLTHPLLPSIEDENEIVRQVEQDRKNLSSLTGYEVHGFAYPCGGVNYSDRVSEIIKSRTGIAYARTIQSNGSFDVQQNLYQFKPTVYHMDMANMLSLGEEFLKMTPTSPKIFYIWGHSYEFDIENTWDRFEQFCKLISGRNDIFYGTNSEVLLSDVWE